MHCRSRGKGEAILFIHGLPTNGNLWNGVIRQLANGFRCLAIDLPGMGKTPAAPYGPGCLAELAEQIEALRERHKIRRWHVVGHDAGAAVAVHYAGRFPSRVRCLSLLSPAIFPELKPFYLFNTLRTPIVGELLAPLVQLLFWDVAMRRALAGESRPELLKAFREPFGGYTGPWKLMRLVRWGAPKVVLEATPAILAGLTMPTLIFHASADLLPLDFAKRASTLVPNATLLTLDSGHFSPVQRSDEIADRLRGFFCTSRHKAEPSMPRRRSLRRSRSQAQRGSTKQV